MEEGPGDGVGARAEGLRLKEHPLDLAAVRSAGYAYERLDQLTVERLPGVR